MRSGSCHGEQAGELAAFPQRNPVVVTFTPAQVVADDLAGGYEAADSFTGNGSDGFVFDGDEPFDEVRLVCWLCCEVGRGSLQLVEQPWSADLSPLVPIIFDVIVIFDSSTSGSRRSEGRGERSCGHISYRAGGRLQSSWSTGWRLGHSLRWFRRGIADFDDVSATLTADLEYLATNLVVAYRILCLTLVTNEPHTTATPRNWFRLSQGKY